MTRWRLWLCKVRGHRWNYCCRFGYANNHMWCQRCKLQSHPDLFPKATPFVPSPLRDCPEGDEGCPCRALDIFYHQRSTS